MMKVELRSRIEKSLQSGERTLLGVGPISLNVISAVVELSQEVSHPFFLIASRRQVDSFHFGGGYVNCGPTEAFAAHIRKLDPQGQIILARDHGGPWQNTAEVDQNLSLEQAMQSAKISFRADIESGFGMIHIDPSIKMNESPGVDEVLNRGFELFGFCFELAQKLKRNILFEVGTDEQGEEFHNPSELQYILEKTKVFCEKNKIPMPAFIVAQTATKVMETGNTGAILGESREDRVKKLRALVELCRGYGVWLKAHNIDYLPREVLEDFLRAGVQAVNVAPEFGVTETLALLQILKDHDLLQEREKFIELANASGKWKKWTKSGSLSTPEQRAVIAGHYVFSHPTFESLKHTSSQKLASKGIDLDAHLRSAIKNAIRRYLEAFRLSSGVVDESAAKAA